MIKNFGTNLLVFAGAFVLLTVFSVIFSDLFLYPFLVLQENHKNITTKILLALVILWISLKIFLVLRKTDTDNTGLFRRTLQALKSLGRLLLKTQIYVIITVLGFIFLMFVLQLNQNILSKIIVR